MSLVAQSQLSAVNHLLFVALSGECLRFQVIYVSAVHFAMQMTGSACCQMSAGRGNLQLFALWEYLKLLLSHSHRMYNLFLIGAQISGCVEHHRTIRIPHLSKSCSIPPCTVSICNNKTKLCGHASGDIATGTYRPSAGHQHFVQLSSNVFVLEGIDLKEE